VSGFPVNPFWSIVTNWSAGSGPGTLAQNVAWRRKTFGKFSLPPSGSFALFTFRAGSNGRSDLDSALPGRDPSFCPAAHAVTMVLTSTSVIES